MFRLSNLTDYAVVVMSAMARQTACRSGGAQAGAVQTVSQIAERTGVPAPTVAKLMKALVPAGLMVSHRGAAGGYALSRPPEAISIAEIIAALDGPIAITHCVDGAESSCGVERLCPMRGNWEKVNGAVRDALEKVTLPDMMTPVPDFLAAESRAKAAG